MILISSCRSDLKAKLIMLNFTPKYEHNKIGENHPRQNKKGTPMKT